MNKIMNFRLIVTLLLVVAYVGALGWAVYVDKLDVPSFIAGIGPSFGVAWKYWFPAAEG